MTEKKHTNVMGFVRMCGREGMRASGHFRQINNNSTTNPDTHSSSHVLSLIPGGKYPMGI
jgi:hypothetical protein